ncbi:MAG: prepilin peptidase, partial [Candidatus Eremiobacteraeota bacterium]|nr:prepilin peptidase [Candidatus Eremiobacteraeota bacterium]
MIATAGLAACVLAVVYDTAFRRIPNWLTLPLLAAGPVLWLFSGHDALHHAWLAAVSVAVAIFAGAFIHRMRILGGGDVKLLAALVGFVP